MAKPKQVGYVELEWTCPTCGKRNGGSVKVCPSCGAPQPASANFEMPEQATVVATGDAAAAQIAKTVAAGPDVQCPFCGARNSATATACHQCQAPLQGAQARAQGKSLGALPSGAPASIKCHVCGAANAGSAQQCTKCGAPLQRRAASTQIGAPAPLPAPQHGGVALWWLGGIGVLVIATVAILAWLGLRSQSYTAVVEGARWERTIAVLGYVPVQQRAWQDEVPEGAEVLACRDELYGTSDTPVDGGREVCGTPYTVDTGTGYGNVMQDCEYQVFAPMCSYETMQWQIVTTAVASGEGFSPQWPQVASAPDRKPGDRSERFMCDVQVDGKDYSFALSADEYAQCVPASRWRVELNGLGGVVAAEPVAAR